MKESSTLKLLPHVVLDLHSFRPASRGTSGPKVFASHCKSPFSSTSPPSFVLRYSGEVGDGLGARSACGLTMTCMTKSFWILVSCSRVLSVSSLPEKNQRWWVASMSSWACSCFLSCPMESAMLALRRRSLPVDSRTCGGTQSALVNTVCYAWR